MRRFPLVLLCLFFILSLVSCGDIPPQQETTAQAYQRGYDDGWEAGYEAARASAGSSAPRPVATTPPATTTYILNKNTKKFHYPTCSSVNQMKDSNKWYYEGTRDEVIAMGYDPCGRCHP